MGEGTKDASGAPSGGEGRYRRLVELASETIAVHSDGRFVYVNAAGVRLLGAEDAADLVGRRVLDFVHPDYVGLVEARIRQNQERGQSTERAEIRMVRLDGAVVDVETRGIPVTYEGRPATQVFILDVADRRRAEEERARVVDEYETIIGVLPNVVYRWRRKADGRMYPTYIEGALAAEFGVTTERSAGKTLEELFPLEFRETVEAAFARAFVGETVEFPSRIGERLFANVAMPFHPDGPPDARGVGAAEEIVGFVSDVTERSQAEAEIRRLNAVLESRVAERTAQLEATVLQLEANERRLRESEADLRRSRERLVKAREEERRRLRRDLHDGLGPALAGLAFGLDAARNLLDREPAMAAGVLGELVGQAREAASDLKLIVRDLRPPALDELGLVGALRERVLRHGGPSYSFEVAPGDGLPPLPAAVEVACYRIAQEATTNAACHARARSCRARLSVEGPPREAEGGAGERRWLVLEVTDDGVGLPRRRRDGEGLSSMRERAAELGGECSVVAVPGGGTRVVARLPLGMPEDPAEAVRASAGPDDGGP